MRVLIVDDEMKVCMLIRHLINWEAFDMEIIGMITDGDEALKTIIKEKPDVVITDIRMPGLDGIQLVEQTINHGLNVYFVIVSGYSQFTYAKQAVRLGVEDYLVKPIKKTDLEAVLVKIRNKQLKTSQDQEEKAELKRTLVEVRSQIRNNVMQDIFNSSSSGKDSLDRLRSMYGCELADPYYYLLLFHLYTNNLHASEEELQFALSKIRQFVSQKVDNSISESFYLVQDSAVFLLVNTSRQIDSHLFQTFKYLSVNLPSVQEVFPDSNLTVSISNQFSDLFQSRKKAERLRLLQMCRFFPNKQPIFLEKYLVSSDSTPVDKNYQKQILHAIEIVSIETLERTLDELFEFARQSFDHEGPAFIDTFLRQIIQTFLYGVELHYQHLDCPSFDYFQEGIQTLYRFDSICDWLKEEFFHIIEYYDQTQKDRELKPIRQAKQFIEENFSGSLSLESVSKQIGLNPAYLSSIFKKTTGQSFLEYLTGIRIEHAKNLLIQSEMDINDIAWEVGYSDVKYFSKIFKKSTSLTPMEYRRLYQ